ncbi:NACHT domain-containing protein [Zoogloea ramigera]|uniref:NACHT domain-containing protein n=1 Tax=Zoogloea ramigera TaxID=350 RepID=UPI003FA21326
MASQYKQNMSFEADVRRVAEAVWSLEPGACQPAHYENDSIIRELDGIARLRDVTHLLMVTTSTKLEKAKSDIKKLNAAEAIERSKAPAVSKWLITQVQLDAQHIEHAKKSNVTVLTLEQFQRRFFDSYRYLSLRARAAFGSARDPHTDSINIAEDAYVPLPMAVAFDSAARAGERHIRPVELHELCEWVINGRLVVLLAPFGAGKSLTTREVFRELAKNHKKNSSGPTPFVLNLREHWGEDYSDEILDRHARTIGYTPREDVVIAWRAGMASLLLDGFDEVASQSIVRTDDKNFMRDARRRALQGVRDFTNKIPARTGAFICGRDHYFDSYQELVTALGIAGKDYIIVTLDEFTEDGAQEFLRRNGIGTLLPDWLPRKPLILAYLLKRQLFDEILAIDSSKGFGFAWNSFLDLICEREAGLEGAVMDPLTLRSVMERLADSVRSKPSGLGPITGTDLSEAYNIETGQGAGEGVLAQLQRLPGLTQRDSDPGSRSFVDEDMLAALQGSAFAKQVLGSFSGATKVPLTEMSDKAIAMASYLLLDSQTRPETLVSIVERIFRSPKHDRISDQLAADCIMVAINIAIDLEMLSLDFRGVVVDSASFGRFSLDDIAITGLEVRNSTVREVAIGSAVKGGVRFNNCMVLKLSGAADETGIPVDTFGGDCEILEYDNMATNNAVLQLDISPQLKALVTILRKLYKQSGAGRKITALMRGITQPEVQRYIDPVVHILERHRFVTIFSKVVHPVRKQSCRVNKILSSPTFSNDELVLDVKML